MFDFFKSQGYINYNPFPVRKLKPKKIITVPEKELNDILQRLKVTNRKHYQVIFLYLATGLRRSELVKLQWKDIDLKNNIIAVMNAKDAERIDYLPIYSELREFFLEEFPERKGKIFDYTRGDSIRKLFARFLEREKFNHYSIHTLRKTYISRLVNSGLTRYDVMALARHKKIETTLRYYTKMDLDRIGREVQSVQKWAPFWAPKLNSL
jgi:integrase